MRRNPSIILYQLYTVINFVLISSAFIYYGRKIYIQLKKFSPMSTEGAKALKMVPTIAKKRKKKKKKENKTKQRKKKRKTKNKNKKNKNKKQKQKTKTTKKQKQTTTKKTKTTKNKTK